MGSTQRLTAPDPNSRGWPKGIAYIIGNEGCERYSYYGMRAILFVYLTHLLELRGFETSAAKDEATHSYHLFSAGVYAFPIIGAIIADRLLGKYRTILWLSIVYCLGHACLAFFEENYTGFSIGLGLIAVGSGGIKPCVSAHVGDQFGKGNWHRIPQIYPVFYFTINLGAFLSQVLTPWTYERFGPRVAFGVPGVLMAVATWFFWLGRNEFVHVPAKPGGRLGALDVLSSTLLFLSVASLMFFREVVPGYHELSWAIQLLVALAFLVSGLLVFGFRQRIDEDQGFLAVLLFSIRAKLGWLSHKPRESEQMSSPLHEHGFFGAAARKFGHDAAEGPQAVLKIVSVTALVTIFWALFDQGGSSWLRQAQQMDRNLMGFEVLPAQVQAINPVLVMLLVPAFTLVVYPALERTLSITLTPLRRMTAGMVLTSLSFAVVAIAQMRIEAGHVVHISWQLFAYVLITAGEVMISVTGLEFAYTQAPSRMKSTVMGFWFFAIALGNQLVAVLADLGKLPLDRFFWVFAVLMALAALLFAWRARGYQYVDYTQ